MKKKHEPLKPRGDFKKKPSKEQVSVSKNSYWPLLIILFVSFVAYLPVLHNGFVNLDDDQYIQENFLIRTINLKEIFSAYFMGNYHPLTIFVLAIEYKLFGLVPTGYHVVNLFFHLINVFLVYRVVLLLSENNRVALVASLLFGVHPIHVESVAWASELKDLLYTFFFLLSFIYYLKYIKSGIKKFYFWSLILFLPALLSKAMAASLPLVLVITDYFKGRKINLKNSIEKIPFFLMALVFGIVAIYAQKSTGAIAEDNVYSLTQRIIFASYGYVTYFIKIIFPVQLSAFYPYPVKSGEAIPSVYYMYPLLIIGILTFVFYSIRRTKKIIFAIGFFTATILLVLQLLPVGGAIMADRYCYIPSIGLFYLAAEGINYLWTMKSKFAAGILTGVFVIFFSAKTYTRCEVWKNGMTLWNDVISQYQNIPLAYNSRGVLFDGENKFREAISDFTKAIELNPNYDKAYNNRGNLLMKSNRPEDAIRDYNHSIVLKPDYYGSYKNRGNNYMSRNKPDSALADYSRAISLNPDDAETYFYRGNALRSSNRNEEALNDYQKAIQLRPGYLEAYFTRGMLYMNEMKNEEALKDFNSALKINPEFVEGYLNRGNLLLNEHRFDEAMKDYNDAARLQPDNPKIYYNRGNLLGNLKKYAEAINDFSTAIKLKGDYALAFFGRGITQCNSGNKEAGCRDLQNAISLGFQPAVNAFNSLCR